jgi:cytochrome c oxidase subunit 2
VKRVLGVLFGSATVLAALAAGALAQSTCTAVARGERVFVEQGCYGCHTVGKTGTLLGPDLSHVGSKYAESYLQRWLSEPQQQKPTAHMPKIDLSEPDIRVLAAYLASLT